MLPSRDMTINSAINLRSRIFESVEESRDPDLYDLRENILWPKVNTDQGKTMITKTLSSSPNVRRHMNGTTTHTPSGRWAKYRQARILRSTPKTHSINQWINAVSHHKSFTHCNNRQIYHYSVQHTLTVYHIHTSYQILYTLPYYIYSHHWYQ